MGDLSLVKPINTKQITEQKNITATTDNDVVNSIFDLINKSERFGNNQIDIIICEEVHWFKGKDIANILGYKNTTKSLRDHIKSKNKKTISELVGMSAPFLASNYQKNTIYINEAGLYQLIMKSKLEIAEQFQDWVTDTLLPKIRKVGQEKFIRQLEESKQLIEEKDQRITKLESKQLKLESFVRNIKKLDKNQFFYIGTTQNYARQNRFEYGGVKDSKDLKPRLATYNTGRAETDLFYYTKLFKCNNYKLIEDRIGSVLMQFKDKPDSRKEMIHLRYNLLIEVVDFICENYDREIEYINSRCQHFLNDTIEQDSIVPEAIDLNDCLEITVRKNNVVVRQKKIDITGWDDAKINEIFETNINLYANEKQKIQYDFSTQKNTFPLELSWSMLTPYLKVYHGLAMMVWREKFRDWYVKEKPTQLRISGIKCA